MVQRGQDYTEQSRASFFHVTERLSAATSAKFHLLWDMDGIFTNISNEEIVWKKLICWND